VSAGMLPWNCPLAIRVVKISALAEVQVLIRTLCAQHEMFNIQRPRPFGPWFAAGSFRSIPVKTDLRKLISEYFAIEKMDRNRSVGRPMKKETGTNFCCC
jgi:hypothetical protein